MKSREFVNLRCWKLCSNGEIVEDFDIDKFLANLSENETSDNTANKFETIIEVNEDAKSQTASTEIHKSSSDSMLNRDSDEDDEIFHDSSDKTVNLSKSLGAKHFETSIQNEKLFKNTQECLNKVYVSAAVSVDNEEVPPSSKFIRQVACKRKCGTINPF